MSIGGEERSPSRLKDETGNQRPVRKKSSSSSAASSVSSEPKLSQEKSFHVPIIKHEPSSNDDDVKMDVASHEINEISSNKNDELILSSSESTGGMKLESEQSDGLLFASYEENKMIKSEDGSLE